MDDWIMYLLKSTCIVLYSLFMFSWGQYSGICKVGRRLGLEEKKGDK